MKPWFDAMAVGQRAALKILYGCELDNRIPDPWGLTERDYWALFQEKGTYDALGYPHKPPELPYTPKAYAECWAVTGVRAGKSDRLAATVVVYEAVCGGHEAYLRKGRKALCFQIAQDLRMARYSLHSIRSVLETMAFVNQPFGRSATRVLNVTADSVELWNGLVIATCPPTVKSVRGYDSPAAVLDEVGVWAVDLESANPDREVFTQVVSRQAQFEDPIIVGISSPWAKVGLLYERYTAGTEGSKIRCAQCAEHGGECPRCASLREPHKGRLVLHATSASLGNPLVTRKWLESKRNSDPKAFERECLARFQDSLSGFLDSTLLEAAVERGVVEHPPEADRCYVAAFDPAFRRDAFGFAIGHAEEKGVVIDLIRKYQPLPGMPPLNPNQILQNEIVPLLRSYRVVLVYSDQHHFDSLNQLALQHHFALECVPFSAQSKADIYGNLKQLVNARRFAIIDHPEALGELSSLEMKLTEAGNVAIAAPKGQHDDLATVVALTAHKAVWMLPAAAPAEPAPKTGHDEIFEQVEQQRQHSEFETEWD